MASIQVAFILPFLLISPIAGVMVDRYNRKLMMMISDFSAATATIFIFVFLLLGRLEIWHIYLAVFIDGLGNAFQWPAYSAAIGTMIPKEQLGKANGLMSLLEAGPGVFAPLLAGTLLPVVGLKGILIIDLLAFGLAVTILSLTHIPQPKQSTEGKAASGGFLKEAVFGFQYIFRRPSLLSLQMLFFVGNLIAGIGTAVVAPMVLMKTQQNSMIFGTVQTVGSVGGILGGILMSAWGGFKKKTKGIIYGWIVMGFFGLSLLGVKFNLPAWLAGMFISQFIGPIMNGSSQALWQAKVPQDLQGRVFSARRLIAWTASPISPLIGGALADFVLEPAMQGPSLLRQIAEPLAGSGPGAGMGLLIIMCGIVLTLVGLAARFTPIIYDAETLLPDYDAGENTDEPNAAIAAAP